MEADSCGPFSPVFSAQGSGFTDGESDGGIKQCSVDAPLEMI
jgi:hypothetical protein